MNWIQSTNAKEIGTLYLIFAVFAGMIGTAFSVLVWLELSSPEVQILQGDPQRFKVIIFIIMIMNVCGFVVYIFPFYRSRLDIAISRLNYKFTFLFKKGQKMNMETMKFLKQVSLSQLTVYIDYILFTLFICFFILDLDRICITLVEILYAFIYNSSDCLLQMAGNNGSLPENSGLPGSSGSPNGTGGNPGGEPGGFPGGPTINNHNTNVQIIHDDGSWSNTIRSLFIYGSGALRLQANITRGGSPFQRAFIVGASIAADSVSRVFMNAINDPNYVRSHMNNWITTWNADGSANVQIDRQTEQAIINSNSSGDNTGGIDETAKSLIGGDIDFSKFSETIFSSSIMEYLHNFFEPVQSSFSNELLSWQINFISILLFMLTVFILIFFISLLFNITVFIFSDKLLNYFSNKYIRWYLSFNKKVIGFEIIMLSGWIIYLLYLVLYGLHYIATHPIIL